MPVYDTVEQAAREEDANASVIFVPPAFAAGDSLDYHSSVVVDEYAHRSTSAASSTVR